MKKVSNSMYVAILILLSSCTFHASNWQSNSTAAEDKASFRQFNGNYIVKAHTTTGNALSVSCTVELTAGTLDISVLSKRKSIWSKQFSVGQDNTQLQLEVNAPGQCKMITKGKNASGSFSIQQKEIPAKKIQVKINKNIELFGLMMQLDMGPDLEASKDSVLIENKKSTWRDWYAMSYTNYLRYKQFDSCVMMQLYRKLLNDHLYNDFFIGFLLQADEVPFAKINSNTDSEAILPFSPKRNWEEARKNAAAFLDTFNQFYALLHFSNYLEENKQYYTQIKEDVEKNLPDKHFIPTMEHFYRKSFNAYYLMPSLNIPTSMGFGKMNRTNQAIYNTFGPFSFQSFDKHDLRLGFDYPARIAELTVHEFGHSFVNPAVDHLPDELLASTAYLYIPLREEMSKKAYTTWSMCLYEHFVKAGEVIINRKLNSTRDTTNLLQQFTKSGFIYVPFIVNELEAYDKNPDPGKSYTDAVKTTMEHLKKAY